jgi:hypothetical protein
MSDEPTKLNWTPERAHREGIKLMEFWWDWVDSGKSFEELKIMVDILAAGGAISERLREVSHQALELIRTAPEAGLNRDEAMAYLRGIAKS